MLIARLGSAALVAALPLFLVSAMAPVFDERAGFDGAAIGASYLGYFAVSALFSTPASALVMRHGNRAALVGLAAVSGIVCAVVALSASVAMIVIACSLAGLANALLQPAVASTIVSHVSAGRRPLAVGAVMAGIPAAALLTGVAAQYLSDRLSVAAIFAIGAAMAVAGGVFAGFVPCSDLVQTSRGSREAAPIERRFWSIATAAFLASLAANALPAFYATSVATYGVTSALSSIALPVAVITCVGVRLIAGAVITRAGGALLAVLAALLAAGAVGYALMANEATFVPGLVLAYGAGWGWVGVANAYPLTYPANVAPRVAARLQIAVFAGSASGPLIFSVLAAQSVSFAWHGMAVAAILSTAAALAGIRRRKR